MQHQAVSAAASVVAEVAAFLETILAHTQSSLPFAMEGVSCELSGGAPLLWLPLERRVDEATPDDATTLEFKVGNVWEALEGWVG